MLKATLKLLLDSALTRKRLLVGTGCWEMFLIIFMSRQFEVSRACFISNRSPGPLHMTWAREV